MRFALAVLLPMAILASGVSYYSSHAVAAQGAAAATDAKSADPKNPKPAEPKPADLKEKDKPAASPAAGETTDKAAPVAVKPSEPAKTAPAKEAAAAPAPAPAAKPAPAVAVAEPPAVKMPPLKGSRVKDDDNSCFQCHTTSDAWDKNNPQYRFYIPLDTLKKDVHYQKGVNCVDCHGGDATVMEPKAHQAKDDFRSKLPDIEKFCAHCHATEVIDLRKSIHAKAGVKNAQGEGSLLSCA